MNSPRFFFVPVQLVVVCCTNDSVLDTNEISCYNAQKNTRRGSMTLVKQNRYIPPDHYAAIRRRLSPRMVAMCDLLRWTGYRVDDVLHTTVGDWRGDHVTITESKTGNVRTVHLNAIAVASIRKLLAYRPGVKDDEPMFPGERLRTGDTPWLHRSTVWRRFTAAVKAAGLDGHGYTIHSLRKMYAVERYDQTQSLLAVQHDLGHKKIDTTLWYVCGSDIRL